MLLLPWLGCAQPNAKVHLAAPAQRLVAVAVAPLEMPKGSPDFEGGKRSQDVLEVLWSESDWRVLGPAEFRILHRDKLDDPGPLTATDLVVSADALKLNPKRIGLLTTSVFVRESAGQSQAKKGEVSGVGYHGSSDVGVSLLLRDANGNHLAEMEIVRPVDPFEDKPSYDNRPELRAAVQELIRLLVEQCPTCVSTDTRPAFDLRPSPAVLLTATDAHGQSLRERIATAGLLEKDQLLWSNLQYLEPEIDLTRARVHLAHPTSACLGEEPPSPFVAGDCVLAIDGQAMAGRFAVARRLAGGSATVEVLGADGERRTLTVP